MVEQILISGKVPGAEFGVGFLLLISLALVSLAGCCATSFNWKIILGLCLPCAGLFVVLLLGSTKDSYYAPGQVDSPLVLILSTVIMGVLCIIESIFSMAQIRTVATPMDSSLNIVDLNDFSQHHQSLLEKIEIGGSSMSTILERLGALTSVAAWGVIVYSVWTVCNPS
eukprot:gene938-589_t